MLQFVVASALIATAVGYGNNGYGAATQKFSGFGQMNKISSFGSSYGGFAAKPVALSAVSQGYGNGYGASTGFVANQGFAANQGFGAVHGVSHGLSHGAGQTVQAAIQTTHNVEFRDVESGGQINPTTVEVGASPIPLTLLFRSASSNLNIQQAHDGAKGSVQESSSEDEPHVLKHSVTKPVIQEVREIISPFRKITQEVQPVQEQVLTIVSRNQGGQAFAGATHGAALGGAVGSTVHAVNTGANYATGNKLSFVAAPVQSGSFGFTGNNAGFSKSHSASFGSDAGYSKAFNGFAKQGASAGFSAHNFQASQKQY